MPMVKITIQIGSISKPELREAFLYGWPSIEQDNLDKQIDKIFELVDLNVSGGIDYTYTIV